jgi:hypothetical protein
MWKEDLVHATFVPVDAEAILKIKTSRSSDEDVIAWQPERNGVFSVRSAYKLALEAHPDQCSMASASENPNGKHACWGRIW